MSEIAQAKNSEAYVKPAELDKMREAILHDETADMGGVPKFLVSGGRSNGKSSVEAALRAMTSGSRGYNEGLTGTIFHMALQKAIERMMADHFREQRKEERNARAGNYSFELSHHDQFMANEVMEQLDSNRPFAVVTITPEGNKPVYFVAVSHPLFQKLLEFNSTEQPLIAALRNHTVTPHGIFAAVDNISGIADSLTYIHNAPWGDKAARSTVNVVFPKVE